MEAAGVLSTTFGLGFVLSSTLSLAPHVNLRTARCPLRIIFALLLLSLTIWSILQFSTLLVLFRLPCSILAILVALADQISRTLLLALILFAIRPPVNNSSESAVLYILIAARGVLGVVVAGFTRGALMPVCFPEAEKVGHGRAAGITQLGFDGIIMAISVVRAVGAYRNSQRGKGDAGLVAVVVASLVWSLAAFPYQLRVGSIFVRLSPSLITLSILLVLLQAFPMFFCLNGGDHTNHDGQGPGDLPSTGTNLRSSRNSHMQRLGSNDSTIPRNPPMYRPPDVECARTNSSVFRGTLGAPIVHPRTMVSWASEASGTPWPLHLQGGLVETRFPAHAGGRPGISGPILSGGVLVSQGLGSGGRDIRTISLQEATDQERARIDAVFEREEESRRQDLSRGGVSDASETPRTIASFAGLPTPNAGPRHSQSAPRRKPAVPRIGAVQNFSGPSKYQDIVTPQSQREDRSTHPTEDDNTTRHTYSQAGFALAPAPRGTAQRSTMEEEEEEEEEEEAAAAPVDQRVLFMNTIEYNDPALVHSLVMGRNENARSTGRYTPRSTGMLRRSPSVAGLSPARELDESPVLPTDGDVCLTPVLSRKRPTKERDSTRVLFPLGQSEFPSPPRGKGARMTVQTAPAPPIPDEPLPTSPREKTKKGAPPPIKISPPIDGALALSKSAVNNSVTPVTPAPPTPYETAKAWIASVAPVAMNSGPVLVDIPMSRKSPARGSVSSVSPRNIPDLPRRESVTIIDALRKEPRPSSSNSQRYSRASMEKTKDIVIDFGKSTTFLSLPVLEGSEGSESAPSLTAAMSSRSYRSSPKSGRRQSFASPAAFSVGFDAENDIFSIPPLYADATESLSPSSAGFSGSAVISDIEDAIEPEKLYVRQGQRFLPQYFKLGDRIPTFYSSRGRGGYGGRRKAPPVPLGMVPLRECFFRRAPLPPAQIVPGRDSSLVRLPPSAHGIQSRPTILASKPPSNRDSGHNSLHRQLELEVSQQETQWKGMWQTLAKLDSQSSVDSLEFRRLSQSQRQMSIAKLRMGLERRLSIALTSATTDTTTTGSAGGWQKQLAEAQMTYQQNAPQLTMHMERFQEQRVLESELESELGSEVEDDFEDIEPLPPTVYVNPTLVLSPVPSPVPVTEEDRDMYDEIMALDIFSEPKARLWSVPVVLSEINDNSKFYLWKAAPIATNTCRLCTLPSAALDVRPRKRFNVAPMILETQMLWRKARGTLLRGQPGLWQNLNSRPKSTISHHRRHSSVNRRVTCVEEVTTVEATDLMGALRRLWGWNTTGVNTPRPRQHLWRDPKRCSLRVRRTILWPAADDVEVTVFDTPAGGSRAGVRDDIPMPVFEATPLWAPAHGAAGLWAPRVAENALWPHGILTEKPQTSLWRLTQARPPPRKNVRINVVLAPRLPSTAATAAIPAGGSALWTAGCAGDLFSKPAPGLELLLWSHTVPSTTPARTTTPACVFVNPQPQQTQHVHAFPANSAVVRRSKRIVILNPHKRHQQQHEEGLPQQQQKQFVIKVGRRVFSSFSESSVMNSLSQSSSSLSSFSSCSPSIHRLAAPALTQMTKPSLLDEVPPSTRFPDLGSDSAPPTSAVVLPPLTIADPNLSWPNTITDTDLVSSPTSSSPSTDHPIDAKQQPATLWTLTESSKTLAFSTNIPAAAAALSPSRPRPEPASTDPGRAGGALWTLPTEESRGKPQSVAKGLWRDATSPEGHTKEWQRSQELLWSAKEAKRTTDTKPGPPRKASVSMVMAPDRVEGCGGLWNKLEPRHMEEESKGWMVPLKPQHIPEGTVRMVPGKTHPVIVVEPTTLGLPQTQRPVLRTSKSSRTLRVEGMQQVAEKKPEAKLRVGGRLWTAPDLIAPQPETIRAVPVSPLWAKETAQRTTSADPERVVRAPRKTSVDMPKATGSLWDNRSLAVKKGKVVVALGNLWSLSEATQRPALQKSKSSLTVVPVEKAPEVRRVQVKVAGRLWAAPAPKIGVPIVVPTSPLWTKEAARRTTEAKPERVAPAPRKMNMDLPKATGSLWDNRNIVVKKGKVVVSNSLWNPAEPPSPPVLRHPNSSRTVLAMPTGCEERVERVEVKIAGRLWTAPVPKAIAPIPKAAPLWIPETASRTTTAVPERGSVVPRKIGGDLPKATGSLWEQLPQDIVVRKGKVVVSGRLWNHHENTVQRPALRKSKSSFAVFAVKKAGISKPEAEKIGVEVAGRLWTASRTRSSSPAPRVANPKSPLWAKETASRTTAAKPERGIVVPRKMSVDLPKATGSLWDSRYAVTKKCKIVVSSSSLWNHHRISTLQPPVLERSKLSRTLIVGTEEEVDKPQKVRLWVAEAPKLPELPAPKEEAPLWIPATPPPIAPPVNPKTGPPKTAGSLWSGRDVVVKKGKVVVSTANLRNHAEAIRCPVLRTAKSSVTVVPVEKKEEEEEVKEVGVKVAGRLWTARAPSPPPVVQTTVPQTSLWTKEAAKRTTTAVPKRAVTAPRKMSLDLPKATGSLWNNRNVVIKKGKVIVGSSSLWSQPAVRQASVLQRSKSSVTLIAAERQLEEEEVRKVEVKIAGRLWSAKKHPVPALQAVPISPLWTKEAAKRTTTAVPERVATAPRRMSLDLPKATGSLWDHDAHCQVVIKKNKVVVSGNLWNYQPVERPALRRSQSSRTLVAVQGDVRHHNELSVKVGGRMLTARAPSPPPAPKEALWTPPPPPAVVTPPEPSYTWSKHTAARTTSQPPVRRHISKPHNHSITIAPGSLWSHQLPGVVSQPPILRKSKSSITLTAIPEPTNTTEQFLVKVGGRVLTATSADASAQQQQRTLWTPSPPSSAAPSTAVPSSNMLWDPAAASRTTSATPTRSLPVQRKIGVDLAKATGPLWEFENDTVVIPGLSRASTLSQSSGSSDDCEGEDVAVTVRGINSGRGMLWTPDEDDLVGTATTGGTGKRVVVGQQRRDRYFSIDIGPQEVQGALKETIRIGSLRRKLRRME